MTTAQGARVLIAIALLTACGVLGDPVPAAGATAAVASTARVEQNSAVLDGLMAPIALYSDPLLAEVVTAATFPAELADAACWLEQDPAALLAGRATYAATRRYHWDASVESLLVVPNELRIMAAHPRWVTRLGAAFRAQPAAVMQAVQRLRHRALISDALFSTAQQRVAVSVGGREISIEPTQPDTITVSYYWPALTYGPWLSNVPAFAFQPPYDVVFGRGAPIAFGIPINVTGSPWRWFQWDWNRRQLAMLTPEGRLVLWRAHSPQARRRGTKVFSACGTVLGEAGTVRRASRAFSARPPEGHYRSTP